MTHALSALFAAGGVRIRPKDLFKNRTRSFCLQFLKTRIPLRHSLKYFPVLESAATGALQTAHSHSRYGFRAKERDKRMTTRASDGITELLERWSKGEEAALDELMPLVYSELHKIAMCRLRRERHQHTLQPTALVNELFLKFSEQNNMSWQNRDQFFGVAAQLMRRILVDYARAKQAEKRGGDRYCISLRHLRAFGDEPDEDLLDLHDALDKLAEFDADCARVVELRFFGGLTIKQAAEVMNNSHATVEREWKIAKAFLKCELTRTNKPS